VITREDVLAAQSRIAEHVRRTPLQQAGTASAPVWLKCEFMQHTGSFKARGAFNRILTAQSGGTLDSAVGIVAASGGNAGVANAYAASTLGVPATVFVPLTAPEVKVNRIRALSADVRQVGTQYAEAYEAAVEFAEVRGALFCHAYDQLEIAAGAGTVAEEMLEDQPQIDTIVVAVGGGGLFAGITAAAHQRARIVAVEPRSIPTLHAAIEANEPVDVEVSGIAADSLGARRVGDIAFEIAARHPPTSLLVSDHEIAMARSHLWEEYRIPSEYGAATAMAALTSGTYRTGPDERVAVIICGANTDAATLGIPPSSF